MSLLLSTGDQHRIVTLCDSRGVFDDGAIDSRDHEKLFQAGKHTLLATLGLIELEGEKIADRINSLCADKKLQNAPLEMLQAIAADLGPALARLYSKEALPSYPHVFGAVSLRRTSEGVIDFYELNFPVVAMAGIRALGRPEIKHHFSGKPPSPFIFTIGCSDCLPEGTTSKGGGRLLDADLPDDLLLDHIDAIIEGIASENRPGAGEIGGPINVCTIEPEGFRWLRRKPVEKRSLLCGWKKRLLDGLRSCT